MRVFAFIGGQKTELAIKTLCRVCGVSTSGYYDWAAREAAGPTETDQAEADVVERIRAAHNKSRGAYGAPRVTVALARQAGKPPVNHKRVERLMVLHGLQGRCGRRKVRTTIQDPKAAGTVTIAPLRPEGAATGRASAREASEPGYGGTVGWCSLGGQWVRAPSPIGLLF